MDERILQKVDKSDVLIFPFDADNHYSYKHHSQLTLHYPSKKVLSKEVINKSRLISRLPILGFIILIKRKTKVKILFAEASIERMVLPSDIILYWKEIIANYINSSDKTLYTIYQENLKDEISGKDEVLDDIFEQFFSQRNYDDTKIKQVIIFSKEGLLDTNNSALLWVYCSILNHITSLSIDKGENSIKEYINRFKFYKHSVAYGMPIKYYCEFRKLLKRSSNYCVGEEALRRAFVYVGELMKSSEFDYKYRYKMFSETAWRDILCTYQFEYVDNEIKKYNLLIHLIFESYLNTKLKLIDFDTEIKCEFPKKSVYYLDAYLFFMARDMNGNQINYKFYLEFKRYDKSLDKPKDYYNQPMAIKENNFSKDRYRHNNSDKWFYVAITENTPPDVIYIDFPKDNYINFTWMSLFTIIEDKLYHKAVKSIDKSLLTFLKFLEKV